ncbi:MAG: formamidopyrimidine-DNA glycosylase [Candidatus Eisenbacteria bacterium]|nr:formamidopyrimidine-DNA glycosylase [Candidatus Latescibacterota bacterium]MBD3301177.1 formamidopyrimidine-DNA glycosylase [Candidatus Eisenbacteria bacterium]
MPELPDLVVIIEALRARVLDRRLERVRIRAPFVLRTFDPPIDEAEGRTIRLLSRIGKRIVLHLEGERFLVVHLMIAGRLRWKPPGAAIPGKIGLAAFDFDSGTLLLTEAGTKKRASLSLLRGSGALAALDPGGVEPLEVDPERFGAALRARNHTLKRALTDPRIVSGVGNAYSDEILHRARLSPFLLTRRIGDGELARLHAACRAVLTEWIDRLRGKTKDGWPEKVTAFHEEMAAHGRFGKPCPACGAAIQRIVHADNETNYCPRCQTGGRILADRALSRLLRKDWPDRLEGLDEA